MSLDTISLTFTANEIKSPIKLIGTNLSVLDLSGTIICDLDNGNSFTLKKGIVYEFDNQFEEIKFRETAGSTSSLTVFVGNGAKATLGGSEETLAAIQTAIEAQNAGTSADAAYVKDAGVDDNTNEQHLYNQDINTAAVSLSSSAITDLQVIRDLCIGVDTDVTVSLYTTSGTLGILQCKATSGSVQYTPRGKLFKSKDSGEKILLRAAAACNANISAAGYEES